MSPRLDPLGGRGSSPGTPRHVRNGPGLDNVIREIEDNWKLGLQSRDASWSPRGSNNSLADKVYGLIKRLYYTQKPALDHSLGEFQAQALGVRDPVARLGLLYGKLMDHRGTPVCRAGTPQSARSTLLKPPRLQIGNETPEPSRTRAYYEDDDGPESYYTAALDPGSPTDDDEEYATLPSPTLESKAAIRRVEQASPRISLGPPSNKRPSDSSTGPGISPKITKISKGMQPSNRRLYQDSPQNPPSIFKKPSIDMMGSRKTQPFPAPFLDSTSANTSFNTLWSSQMSQANTANTSFTTDPGYHDGDVVYPKLKRTSSTTLGSLNNQTLDDVSPMVEREPYKPGDATSSQNVPPSSSPNYGSLDNDKLLDFYSNVEASVSANSVIGSPPSILPRSPEPRSIASALGPQPSLPRPRGPLTRASSESDIQQPPRSIGSYNSPSKMSYEIRDLPLEGLFVDQVPRELLHFPYFILFICCRLSSEHKISISELLSGVNPEKVQSDHKEFWHAIKKQLNLPCMGRRDPKGVWTTASKNHEGYTFKGRLVYTKNKGQVFQFQPLVIESDKSCRFQRKFGADRFLYLNCPSFDSSKDKSRFTMEEKKQISEKWNQWFLREHDFLGRKWRAFHIKPIRGKANGDGSDKRVILFATEGPGLSTTSVGELFNWFFPFALNWEENFCKAYARLDLGLSRTIPTLTFKPSQIEYVENDKLANGPPEDTQFNDPNLDWTERCNEVKVMNDGCSVMSVGAALQIWKMYEKATDTVGPLPSAFQGRIGGAKGMWMVSAESFTKDPEHLRTWIQITPSQQKFKPHQTDTTDENFDKFRLTFEYSNHSTSPAPSDLHSSFIPIMVDRGVSRVKIANLVTKRLDIERDQLLKILNDPIKMYHWVHKQTSTDVGDIRWQASLPHSLPQKIKHLLQCGFLPTDSPYLAKSLHRFMEQRQIWMERKLRVPLGKSTFLYGIADPLGVLRPGEIHVAFSSPYVDEITGETFHALDGFDILVARQPACRRSDMQKVKTIRHPQLSYLVDVVVFPSCGEYPLAGKLQGGDYDGDLFWLCWEWELVKPFRNAPAPLQSLKPSQYGIIKDTRQLSDVMNPLECTKVDNLLSEVLKFRTTPSLLGQVTNLHEKRAYAENRVHSKALNQLCDIHDLLVDAPKQAYLFTKKDFNKLEESVLKDKSWLPAYKKAMEDCESAKELGGIEKVRKQDYRHRADNVLDYLYFDVVRCHDVATFEQVKNALPSEIEDDSALKYPYRHIEKTAGPTLQKELRILVEGLQTVCNKWNKETNGNVETSEQFNRIVEDCYKMFRALKPTEVNHPEVMHLVDPLLHPGFSLWDSIRASALYCHYPRRPSFVWHMAGEELARMKLHGRSIQPVANQILANMRPKPSKAPKPTDEESDDDFEMAMEYL